MRGGDEAWSTLETTCAERDTRQGGCAVTQNKNMVFQQIDMNNLHSHFHLIVLFLFILFLRLRFLPRSLRFAAVAFFEGQ